MVQLYTENRCLGLKFSVYNWPIYHPPHNFGFSAMAGRHVSGESSIWRSVFLATSGADSTDNVSLAEKAYPPYISERGGYLG